jgi:hypothetical protein
LAARAATASRTTLAASPGLAARAATASRTALAAGRFGPPDSRCAALPTNPAAATRARFTTRPKRLVQETATAAKAEDKHEGNSDQAAYHDEPPAVGGEVSTRPEQDTVVATRNAAARKDELIMPSDSTRLILSNPKQSMCPSLGQGAMLIARWASRVRRTAPDAEK